MQLSKEQLVKMLARSANGESAVDILNELVPDDMVSKEQVEKVLKYHLWALRTIREDIMNELYPPKFQPRKDQVIMGWGNKYNDKDDEFPGRFLRYNAESEHPYELSSGEYKHARPLTVEEIT